ncbi:hypothetical protein PoMZ_12406 [Pyricularia oryzae]|uniref:Uncharacterized protein n=1 Tax=Pyricularia oryzae TaxID=318829 RepID=A0A4P7NU69_PYROR|nr:hypothetical protein PoMZ_12406 [Pyricularia oryzae]
MFNLQWIMAREPRPSRKLSGKAVLSLGILNAADSIRANCFPNPPRRTPKF